MTEQDAVHGQIALFGYSAHDHPVEILIVVIVVFPYVEKPVGPKSEWLMDLEVETN
jgi:hypothetical protein